MIVDSYLRKVVDDSGRREITSSMVRDARKAKRDSFYSSYERQYFAQMAAYQTKELSREQYMAMQQAQGSHAYALCGQMGGIGSALLGGMVYGQSMCPCCGK